jgi:hypothetical protein
MDSLSNATEQLSSKVILSEGNVTTIPYLYEDSDSEEEEYEWNKKPRSKRYSKEYERLLYQKQINKINVKIEKDMQKKQQ